MDECPFCAAQVMDDSFDQHVQWHWINDLHRFDCAKIQDRRVQWIEPPPEQPCTCGLDGMPDPRR